MYSEADYIKALELLSNFTGRAYDFGPPGLPRYAALYQRAKRDKKFAIAFATASDRRRERGGGRWHSGNRGTIYGQDAFESVLRAITQSNLRTKSEFIFQIRPSIPTWKTVLKFAATNEGYAERLRFTLEAKGWHVPASDFGATLEARKREVIASVRAGRALYGPSPRGHVGVASGTTIRRWITTDAAFAAEIEIARFDSMRVAKAPPRWLSPEETATCKRFVIEALKSGHSLESLATISSPLRPSLGRISRWLSSDDLFAASIHKARISRGLTLKQQMAYRWGDSDSVAAAKEFILCNVRDGLTLERICGLSSSLRPGRAVLRRWAKEDPPFGEKLKRASRARQKIKPAMASALLRGKLLLNRLYALADAALSKKRGIKEEDRDDIKNDIVEAVLNGSVEEDQIASFADFYISEHRRKFSQHRERSLDTKLFDDGNATLSDRLSTDEFSYSY